MKIPALFKEYIWLIETINRYGRITFAEISELWKRKEESDGMEFSRTTFNRHRDAILDMFGIIIECDRKDGYRYYIENKDVLDENSVQNWMFSTLSVSNMLDENVALHNRILLESIPSGDNTLQQVIKAMRENRRMTMTYRRYGAESTSSFSAAPYCVKLFRRRWYVLVKLDRPRHKKSDDYFAIYSLDRIENIELQEAKFTFDTSFDAASFFDECFGVVVADGTKPMRIVLRAYGLEQHYLRDLPIHHSQKELKTTDKYTEFEVFIRPTTDFKAHLMSRGGWLQVVSPKSLAKEIQEWHQEAINKYKNDLKE